MPERQPWRAVALFFVRVWRSPALALMLLGSWCSTPALAESEYIEQLQARAENAGLAAHEQWLKLLHMVPTGLGGKLQSTIDFPGFFLSPSGKSDAQAELDATLEAFFDQRLIQEEPPQCRFKARYEWLKVMLGFNSQQLPETLCDRYQAWASAIDADKIHLVFASNDLNSPSSMFGHTLLRIDAKGSSGDQRLLAYAVNYAAQTTRDAGLLYAIKGLGGFYQGHYAVMPYYEKVREYEGFEHRDLWEYPLKLDDETIQKLLWHLWELRGMGSDYFFFGENCSYQLLSLIEAARPDLVLTRPFREGPDYTIPIDAVRALGNKGLLGAPAYRPAEAKTLAHRFKSLRAADQAWVSAYVAGRAEIGDAYFESLGSQTQAQLLEVTHAALYFNYRSGAVARQPSLPRAHQLLVARAKLDAPAEFAAVPTPQVTPDQGHRSGRASFGLRQHSIDDGSLILNWRPAYHDRLDPADGYLPGGELEFLEVQLSADRERLQLDHVQLLGVEAIAPRDELFKPWSWYARLGAQRAVRSEKTSGSLGGVVEAGAGMAWSPFSRSQIYLMPAARLSINRELVSGHELLAGVRSGIAVQAGAGLSLDLSGEALGGLLHDQRDQRGIVAGAQWSWQQNMGVRLTYELNRNRSINHDLRIEAAMLQWVMYY